jgi:hypothetical protein
VERRGRSISPEILEPIRRECSVDRRAGDRPMPEPSLDGTGVVTLVGEGIPAGVAEHVWVNLQFERGAVCGPFHHPGEAGLYELKLVKSAAPSIPSCRHSQRGRSVSGYLNCPLLANPDMVAGTG